MPLGFLGLIEGGLRSKIKGISISVSLVKVKFDCPTIALTTRTPIFNSSLETKILGYITLIGV